MLHAKFDKLERLLEAGLTLDTITSDGTLDITLSSGEMQITLRFDRDEVAEIWPRLFGDDLPLTRRHVVAVTATPTPYGLEDVLHLWERSESAGQG